MVKGCAQRYRNYVPSHARGIVDCNADVDAIIDLSGATSRARY